MADPKILLPPITDLRPEAAWAKVKKAPASEANAAFAAGAGLAVVDVIVRAEPAFGASVGPSRPA